ncbi:Selt selw selh selenoprotein domain containing protein, partial [Globisporangium splendens]
MALQLARRMSRYSWLRLLVTLAIYLLAVPGTVRSTTFNGVAAAPEARPPAAAAPSQEATKRNIADDEIRVYYCSSCGFKQNFQEVKQYLEDKYPHLVDRVHGANYDVDPMKKIFRTLGLDTTLLQKALDNRIGCFAVILLMGSVSQGLISTGAFEVYFNGAVDPDSGSVRILIADVIFGMLQVISCSRSSRWDDGQLWRRGLFHNIRSGLLDHDGLHDHVLLVSLVVAAAILSIGFRGAIAAGAAEGSAEKRTEVVTVAAHMP